MTFDFVQRHSSSNENIESDSIVLCRRADLSIDTLHTPNASRRTIFSRFLKMPGFGNVKVMTQYKLNYTIVMKPAGDSSIKIKTERDQTSKLEIYLSADDTMRNCALMTDLPEQLAAALQLKPANVAHLPLLLQVPLVSLKTLLIKKAH